jgi:hypothetical protein
MKIVVTAFITLVSLVSNSQGKWHPFIGAHLSMDAEGYYVGPSGQLGVDYQLKKRTVLCLYLHYFPKHTDVKYSDGTFEKGKYRSLTGAVLIQKNFYDLKRRGMLVAAGVAIQKTSDDYNSSYYQETLKRTIAVFTIKLGYSFSIKKEAVAVELNAVGPHVGKKGPPPYFEQTIEILTQLSLGARLIF